MGINLTTEPAMNLTGVSAGCNPTKYYETPVVFIVDGDASVREALDLLIRSAGWRTATAASAEEFMARPRAMSPSCLVVELHLPGLTGLDLQSLVLDRAEMPIIFTSGNTDVPATVQAMKAGAFEFLTKPIAADVLLNTIGCAIERSRAALDQTAWVRALQERYKSLTPRQQEILSLVVSGRLNKQIGDDLGISEITVKAHRAKVMRKMKARSLPELVVIAATLSRVLAMQDDMWIQHSILSSYTTTAALSVQSY